MHSRHRASRRPSLCAVPEPLGLRLVFIASPCVQVLRFTAMESRSTSTGAAGRQVRSLPIRGAPRTVYGADGLALVLPIEARPDDVRRAIEGSGRYRLALVDERHRRMDAPRGYLDLAPVEAPREGQPAIAALLAVAGQSIAQAEALMALVPFLLDTAGALRRTAQDAQDAIKAIRDLMK